MKAKYLFFTVPLLWTACSEESTKKEGKVVSAIAAGEANPEWEAKLKEIEKEEAEREKQEKSNVTSLSFDRLEHDFGTIASESQNETTFIVTNTGDKPLIIDEVKASCGCTTPKKPEKPIPPGKSDKIVVGFKPNAEQKNEIIKTVTVAANTDPRISTLTIKSFVK